MSISFNCQPQNETPNLESFYIMYLRNAKLNLRPPYQRNACWNHEQKSGLIDTIMGRCPMPPFLIYKFDEEMECIDGQNRLDTIKKYQEQGPPSDLNIIKPFPWIIKHGDNDENTRFEYVYFKETPEFLVYITELNKKNKNKGKSYRFMTSSEVTRFNDYGLVAQMIKTYLTNDQRKEIFNKWQHGSSISQCDHLKNKDFPFCNWIVSDGIEQKLGKTISNFLKSGNKNWLFDVVRILRVFMNESNSLGYSIISTLKARGELKSSFNKSEFVAAMTKAEKFLDIVKPLLKLENKMPISFLLTYAYLWYTNKSENKRAIIENEDFMVEFAKLSIADDKNNHSTLNNGPQVSSFMSSFPKIKEDFDSEILKRLPVPLPVPYKKGKISADIKKKLWQTHFDKQGCAKCACCGIEDITPLDYEAGHVIAESLGGQTILDNLRPICGGCNRRMGVTNMKDWMNIHYPLRSFK